MSTVAFWEENVGAKFWFLCQLPQSLSCCCGVAVTKDMSGYNLDLGHVVWVSSEGNRCDLTRVDGQELSPLDDMHRRGWDRGKSYKESIDVALGRGSKRSKILDSREV